MRTENPRCTDGLSPCEHRRKSTDNTCAHYPTPHPKCFQCPNDAEYVVHGLDVCEACAYEIA